MNSTSVNGCSVVGRLVVLPILIRSCLVRIPASHPGQFVQRLKHQPGNDYQREVLWWYNYVFVVFRIFKSGPHTWQKTGQHSCDEVGRFHCWCWFHTVLFASSNVLQGVLLPGNQRLVARNLTRFPPRSGWNIHQYGWISHGNRDPTMRHVFW